MQYTDDDAKIMDQLHSIYNDTNNPYLNEARQAGAATNLPMHKNFGPRDRGYAPHEVDKELWAEAIRTYLTDPNYIKTVAPETAAAIRAAVNSHPRLSKIIQFNSAGVPVPVPGNGTGADADGK